MTEGGFTYLNYLRAESKTLIHFQLPRDYLLACRFFHCGIIDRTRTLDQGFDYAILDPIPAPAISSPTFAELCDIVGAEIVENAIQTDREIGVLWSGGIDSTTALIAVMKAAEARGCRERVLVQCSLDSVLEYPGFFLRQIRGRYRLRSVTHPISAFLDPALVNVTGEHGDQLFGSQLLAPYARRGLAGEDYRDMLPLVMIERLRSVRAAWRVHRYLTPVIAAAPAPIRTLFDCLWWLNFALKWQDVTLRLAVPRGEEARAVYESLRHFFRDARFQSWALANGVERCPPVWARYKEAAKRYILDFTGDEGYYRYKEKEDSLRNVLVDPGGTAGYRAFMREDFRPVIEAVELDLPDEGGGVVRRLLRRYG